MTNRRRKLLAALGAASGATTLGLLALHVFAPQRRGVLVVTQIFEPYIVLPALIVTPLALLGRRRPALVVVVLLFGAVSVRYLPQLVSLPAAAGLGAAELKTLSWNLQQRNISAPEIVGVIETSDADLVGLVELVPARAVEIASDTLIAERYPHRVLPSHDVRGPGLLSRYPIIEHESWQDPALLRAVVQPRGGASPIVVYVAHPVLGETRNIGLIPIDVDTDGRDAAIRRLRQLVDADLASDRDVLVMGDFNVTEREPAYRQLSAGLHDVHREVGFGPGHTWRPGPLEFLPFGILRIDYHFGGGRLRPVATAADCTPRGSDHCVLTGIWRRERGTTDDG
ncbi:MAG: endonuclease/exonuclease/phosphatase family protein [Chloroflexota bacterium]|nr:endonuclease/exonuclease/phosphatase family protein [Chloroflexota bacterium]